MNPITASLVVMMGSALLAAMAAVTLPRRPRSAVTGALVAVSGVAAATAGFGALTGRQGTDLRLAAVPASFGPVHALVLAPDRASGVFLCVTGVVIVLAALFGIGYAHGPVASRTGWAAFAAFALGLEIVPAAGDMVTFLAAWELMALASLVLLVADHASRPRVRTASLWYAVMTHLSFLLVLAGFAVLSRASGTTSFADLAEANVGGATASLAFVLLLVGFGTKAGLVPVHVWLPRAHPEAPSHVSAVMSAAMVKMGVYGLILVTVRLLPDGPRWWGGVILALGAISAAYGILQASVTSDLKRLLAFSTTENVGLMVTALGASLVLAGANQRFIAGPALLACYLLVVSHALFKTVLFLGAGAILSATGERDLDRLGGLATRMPWTSAALAVGGLSAAALPISSGFVAEWVLLQALVHGDGRADRLVAVAVPIALALVALTAGLGLLTFVKAIGVGLLARPRSEGAEGASDGSWPLKIAMALGALLVLATGLAPGVVVRELANAVPWPSGGSDRAGGLDLPTVSAVLNPWALSLAALLCALPILLATLLLRRRHPRREVDLPWGCGGARTSPRMQYTATSYAEPLVRVFGAALRPATRIRVVRDDNVESVVRAMTFEQEVVDRVDGAVYAPMLEWMDRVGDRARRLQNGSLHRYLGLAFAALLTLLLVVMW